MKIAIVVGSTRPGRKGSEVGQWVARQAQERDGVEVDLLELADFDLGLLNEPTVPGAANRNYENPQTQAWSRAVDDYDAFVFVTPEYNHSVPAALKNAFDLLYPEWVHKAIGFVGYGADGGVRAIEHWRAIVANAQMHAARAQVSLSMFGDFADATFRPQERRAGELTTLLDQVTAMADIGRTLRQQ